MSSLAIWGLVRVLKRILFGLEPYESLRCSNSAGDAAVASRRGTGRGYPGSGDND